MPRKGKRAMKLTHVAADPEMNGPPYFKAPYAYVYIKPDTNEWIFERMHFFTKEERDGAIKVYHERRRDLRKQGVTYTRFVSLNHSTLR